MKAIAIGMVVLGLSLNSAAADYQPGKYNIDPTHSRVGFEVAHLVFSSVEGNFSQYEAQIELNKDFSKSKVDAQVMIDSIDTDQADRDKHLKSDDFFAATKFPKMTFKTKQIQGTPKDFELIGDLTIRGTTKPVTFKGKLKGEATDGYGNQKVFFDASTKINRKDFGLNWSSMVEAGPVVGDEVEIKLNVQAAKVKEEKKQAKN